MISVHLLKLKFFAANCAFMFLLFIRRKSITAVKSTNGQFPFFSCQQIFINTGFLCNILIPHKALNLCLQLFRVKVCALAVCCKAIPMADLSSLYAF